MPFNSHKLKTVFETIKNRHYIGSAPLCSCHKIYQGVHGTASPAILLSVSLFFFVGSNINHIDHNMTIQEITCKVCVRRFGWNLLEGG